MKIRIGPFECETDATNSFDPSRMFPPGSAILGLPQAPLERMSHKYFTKLSATTTTAITKTTPENYEENFASFMTDSANLLNAVRKRMRDEDQNNDVNVDNSNGQHNYLLPLIEASLYNQPPTLRMVHCSTTRCIHLIDAEIRNEKMKNNVVPPPLQFVVFSNNAAPSVTQRPKMIRETTGTGMAVGGRTQKKSWHTHLFPPPAEMIQVANQSRKYMIARSKNNKNNAEMKEQNHDGFEDEDNAEMMLLPTLTAETRLKQHKLQVNALLPLVDFVELAGQCALQQIPIGCKLFSPTLASNKSQQNFQRKMRNNYNNEFEYDSTTIAEEFSALQDDDRMLLTSRFSSSKQEEVEKLFSRNFSTINNNNKNNNKKSIILATFLDVEDANEADTRQRIDKIVTFVEKLLWRDENSNNTLVTVKRNLYEIEVENQSQQKEDELPNHVVSSVRILMKHLIPVFQVLSIRIADDVAAIANPSSKQPLTAAPSVGAGVPRIGAPKKIAAGPRKGKNAKQQLVVAAPPSPPIKCHKRLILTGLKWSANTDVEEARTVQALTGSNSGALFFAENNNKGKTSHHAEDQTHEEIVEGLLSQLCRKADHGDDDVDEIGDDEMNSLCNNNKAKKESGKRRQREE